MPNRNIQGAGGVIIPIETDPGNGNGEREAVVAAAPGGALYDGRDIRVLGSAGNPDTVIIGGANAPVQTILMGPSSIGAPPPGTVGTTVTPAEGILVAPHKALLWEQPASTPLTATNGSGPLATYGHILQYVVMVGVPTGTNPTLKLTLDLIPILSNGAADTTTAFKNFGLGALWQSPTLDKGTVATGTTVYPVMYIITVARDVQAAPADAPAIGFSGNIHFVNVATAVPLYVQTTWTVTGTTPSFPVDLQLTRS